MKKIFFSALTVFLFSCQDEKKPEVITDSPKPLPEFAYPVERSHWNIGDPGNTKLVLDMYRAWDGNDANTVAGFFADSASMDMPDARRLNLSKGDIYERFAKARKQYADASHRIISAISLHNTDYDEDWVQVLSYNKWSYQDGVKDSMLYFDSWRLKNGKISYLNSLEQKPPRPLLKKLENK